MNIACTSCSARYGVADEKLIGKRVRITCKRCGTVLIVDGNYNPPTVSASTSMAPSPRSSSRPAQEAKPPPPAPEPPFMVAFADGRQEEADVAQIVRFHRAGQLGSDSVVWRDGMADWVDPWDVPEIAAAFRRMGYARPTPAPAPPPPARQPLRDALDDEATQIHHSEPHHAAPLYEDGEDTHVVDSSSLASPKPQRDPRVASSPVATDDEVPTHVGTPRGVATREAAPRAAARDPQRARRVSSHPPGGAETAAEEYQRARREAKSRTAARASSRPPLAAAPPRESVDLFARQAQAGSEEDEAEQPNLGPGHELDIPRLTGARNESSVLFSLDSLLKQEQKSVRPARPPRRDESLLVDSGASLPVGGGIAPALAAPDFTAPITSPPPRFAPTESPVVYEEPPRRSRAWLYMGVLVALGAAGVVGWQTGALRPVLTKLGLATPAPTASASEATPAATASERAAAPAESASPEASASASASAAPSASPAIGGGPAKPPTAAPQRPAGDTPAPRQPSTGTQAAAKEKEKEPATAEKPTGEKPGAGEKPATGEKSAAAEKPASGAGAEPFDAAAAKEALSGATANVASCKEMGGPTGSGRVSITFAPSGRPTSVAVTGDLAGTTVGSCVARLYRGVRVPAFSGDAVTVAKGFAVQ